MNELKAELRRSGAVITGRNVDLINSNLSRGVATGVYRYIYMYTPKSVYLNFFMLLYCLLDPGEIEIAMSS